jgi:SAM-dependent methyltransferase
MPMSFMSSLPASEERPLRARGTDTTDRPCKICGHRSGHKTLVAREMMFGWRDEFDYLECGGCGCLQLSNVPLDLGHYYPDDYYPSMSQETRTTGLKKLLWHHRASYCLTGRGLIGRALVKKYGRPSAGIFGRPDYYRWLSKCGVDFSSPILDVGCGSGVLLFRLHNDGFTNLTGVDPFMKQSIKNRPGFVIKKQHLFDVEQEFDLVMLHHTFEHMPEPAKVLGHIRQILRPAGHALIRIPVASSFAYRAYGANWAQLDAPRHLFLHSVKSVRLLAQQVGLGVREVVFDSDEFQFWASEQYVRDIPLKDRRSYAVSPRESMFSEREIDAFRRRADELNTRGDGDSACFYLHRS